jgi:uncharacterized membrane protein YeaQ/YmgE (transglycosylase-associated protein family)
MTNGKSMTWTFTNLVIQIIAGVFGGHAAAVAAKEHNFGALGHTIMGAIGGGVSGSFLQTFAGTVVTASGSVGEPTAVEQAVVQGLTGAVVGGISVLVAGFIKHSFEHHS